MKRKFLFLLSLFVFIFSFVTVNTKTKAFTPLDYIESYKIIVNPNDDATLNMEYEISWKVLDSSSEGPLEWVKIGVANRFIENIQILSSDIKSAYYYYDNGAYIRLDLSRDFYQGSVANLHFSFVQKRIFTNNDGNIEYGFIPGWFPEIKVDKLEVFWLGDKTPIYNDAKKMVDGYYYWTDSLDYNETIKCSVKYNMDSFPTIDLSMDYSDSYATFFEEYLPLFVFFIFVGVFLTIYIITRANSDKYYQYRGFSGANYYYHPWWYHHNRGVDKKGDEIKPPVVKSSGSSGHGGTGCACACACACAGGGRAGCARKDFYPPSINIEDIKKR